MRLSPNFTLEELCTSAMAKSFGLPNIPDEIQLDHLLTLANGMELVRLRLGGKPIHVTSGFRGTQLNAAVGGVKNSDHALGYACDFQCPQFGTPALVAEAIAGSALQFDQLIHEHTPIGWWVHISFNPRMRGEILHTTDGKHYGKGLGNDTN